MTEYEHGTYAGYQTHKRQGTEPCDDCRLANNAYQRAYRSQDPVGKAGHKARALATRRARQRVVEAHRDEYSAFYAQELEALRGESA